MTRHAQLNNIDHRDLRIDTRRSALFQGRERHYYEIMWEERKIWGATAAMIVNLSRRLGA